MGRGYPSYCTGYVEGGGAVYSITVCLKTVFGESDSVFGELDSVFGESDSVW